MHPTHDPDFLGARRAAAPPSFGFRPTRETPWHASQARPGGARVSLASAVGLARRLRKERAGSREDVRMRRTTASTDEKRHAACRTRPQTGVIQRALEYAMGIHDHRRWRLRRVLVGHAQIWLQAGCRTLPPIGHTAPPIYVLDPRKRRRAQARGRERQTWPLTSLTRLRAHRRSPTRAQGFRRKVGER